MNLKGRVALALGGALLTLACTPLAEPPPRNIPPPATPLPPGKFTFQGAIAQGSLVIGNAPAGTVSLTLDGKPVELSRDGRFLIGFGRDAEAKAVVEALLVDGRVVREDLDVRARQWDIQSLPTLPRGTTPTPEFLARRKSELERINTARAIQSGSEGWRQHFVWPVIGRISGVFGSQRIYAGEPGAPHSGVDVARPTGTPVAAPADGLVVLAADAPFTLEGNLLIIDHGMGVSSAFLHLSRIDVTEGQRVVQGQVVGAIGATGRATGPHLHWGMMWRGVRVDPQTLVGAMPAN